MPTSSVPTWVLPTFEEYRRRYQYGLPAILDPAIFLLLMGRAEAEAEAKQSLREPDKLPRLRTERYLAVLNYLSGESTEAELLEKLNKNKGDRCEAHFFVAMRRLSQGDRAGAKQHFGDVVATDIWDFLAYHLSRSFLARMNDDANWPPWIDAIPERCRR